MGMVDRILCLSLGAPRMRKILFVFIALGALQFLSWSSESRPRVSPWPAEPVIDLRELRKLKTENERLKAALEKISPNGMYIAIDTGRNRLYLEKGQKIILEAVCSTGNGKILMAPDKKRTWEFDTPRGERRIVKKVYRPVWTKPDWAFIEEGERLPTSFSERVEEDMLGDYALHIGDAYMIHGTLYQRLLGRSVTHGCIRLGDDDLEKVYKLSAVGTPVFIF